MDSSKSSPSQGGYAPPTVGTAWAHAAVNNRNRNFAALGFGQETRPEFTFRHYHSSRPNGIEGAADLPGKIEWKRCNDSINKPFARLG
jgi:hypothetical protein